MLHPQRLAVVKLRAMGRMSRQEITMALAIAWTVGFWIIGGMYGISTLASALLGLSILLIAEVRLGGVGWGTGGAVWAVS